LIAIHAAETPSPSPSRLDMQSDAVASHRGIANLAGGQFDYRAKFTLDDKKIVVGQGDVEIQFNLKVCTGYGVEFGPNENDHIVPGFRLYSGDTNNLIYEGRIVRERVIVFPDQWIPFTLVLPGDVVRGAGATVLVFDLVNEGQFWFAERGGPEYRFPLEFVDSREASAYRDSMAPAESHVESPSREDVRDAAEGLTPNPADAAPQTIQSGASKPPNSAEHVVTPEPATSNASGPVFDAARAASRPEQHDPVPAHVFDDNFQTPQRRAAGTATSRSALSQCFRMKVSLIDADPANFRVHCYRTLLRRDPESEVASRQIVFADIGARIGYWKAILLSREFGAEATVPPRDEIIRRIIESLGGTVANTLLGYALRIESVLAGTYPRFVERLGETLLSNSFSSSMVDEVYETGDARADYSSLFEGLVDLAVEFSLGLSRLNEMFAQIEDLQRRAETILHVAGKAGADSAPAVRTGFDEIASARQCESIAPVATSYGKPMTGHPPLDRTANLFAGFPRRQPTRWAPQ